MKKPLWSFYSFCEYYIYVGIDFVFDMNLWRLGRQADMWKLIVTIICVAICWYIRVHKII